MGIYRILVRKCPVPSTFVLHLLESDLEFGRNRGDWEMTAVEECAMIRFYGDTNF